MEGIGGRWRNWRGSPVILGGNQLNVADFLQIDQKGNWALGWEPKNRG